MIINYNVKQILKHNMYLQSTDILSCSIMFTYFTPLEVTYLIICGCELVILFYTENIKRIKYV